MASELHNVRLKLEEKRRRIESEKRKMEQAMNNQRQKLGKEAFMQAVVKGVSTTQLGGRDRLVMKKSQDFTVRISHSSKSFHLRSTLYCKCTHAAEEIEWRFIQEIEWRFIQS